MVYVSQIISVLVLLLLAKNVQKSALLLKEKRKTCQKTKIFLDQMMWMENAIMIVILRDLILDFNRSHLAALNSNQAEFIPDQLVDYVFRMILATVRQMPARIAKITVNLSRNKYVPDFQNTWKLVDRMVFLLKNINTECKFIREVRVNLSFNFARYPSCGNFTFQAQFENSLFVKCADLLESHLCTNNNQVFSYIQELLWCQITLEKSQ